MWSFYYFKYEMALLFLVCYIIFLNLCTKFVKFEKIRFELNNLDYLFVSMLFIYLLLWCYQNLDGETTILYLGNHFIYNDFIRVLKYGMTSFFFAYLIIIHNFNNIIKIKVVEYLLLVFLCFFSLSMIIISNHLFVIFLFLEIVNICLYCMIGLNKNSNKGIEAAFKYFIQSSFVTIIGFFAISIIYILSGTLFINELVILLQNKSPDDISWVSVFVCLLFVTIFFKLGIFPLHSWIADVYQGSYLIVALFVATVPKFAYMYLFWKIIILLPLTLANYCSYMVLFSMIYGSIVTLYQISFKRLIAYGSMVHMGFIIYSLCLNSPFSIAASLFYLFVYIILMVFVFCFMFFLFEQKEQDLYFLDDISRLNIVLNNNKILSFYFSYIILSLAGLPFFIGFISKWYVFLTLLYNNHAIEAIVLLCVSVLSASYYIRLIRFLYFIENKNKKIEFHSFVKLNSLFFYLIAFLFILNILIIFFHNWIYLYLFKCALSLFI
jgi:NADH-quinone oxidoreductase subunit N